MGMSVVVEYIICWRGHEAVKAKNILLEDADGDYANISDEDSEWEYERAPLSQDYVSKTVLKSIILFLIIPFKCKNYDSTCTCKQLLLIQESDFVINSIFHRM